MLIKPVTTDGVIAMVPLYRDEIEAMLKALSNYNGVDQTAVMMATDQLNEALRVMEESR